MSITKGCLRLIIFVFIAKKSVNKEAIAEQKLRRKVPKRNEFFIFSSVVWWWKCFSKGNEWLEMKNFQGKPKTFY